MRLERKIRYEFAKLKAKGQLRAMFRSHYASAVSIAESLHRASAVDLPAAPIDGEKHEGLQVDPDHGVRKHPRHIGNLAEGVYCTPMSSQTHDTPATSPDIGIGHDDDVIAVTFLHGNGGSLTRQAPPGRSLCRLQPMRLWFMR